MYLRCFDVFHSVVAKNWNVNLTIPCNSFVRSEESLFLRFDNCWLCAVQLCLPSGNLFGFVVHKISTIIHEFNVFQPLFFFWNRCMCLWICIVSVFIIILTNEQKTTKSFEKTCDYGRLLFEKVIKYTTILLINKQEENCVYLSTCVKRTTSVKYTYDRDKTSDILLNAECDCSAHIQVFMLEMSNCRQHWQQCRQRNVD